MDGREDAVERTWQRLQSASEKRELGNARGYLPLFAAIDASHVQATMASDDDLAIQKSAVKLALAGVGVTWYAVLWSVGLVGCWAA